MHRRISVWLRLVASGGLMLGTVGSGCLADTLRDLSDDIDDVADDIDGDSDNDLEEFLDDLEDLFD